VMRIHADPDPDPQHCLQDSKSALIHIDLLKSDPDAVTMILTHNNSTLTVIAQL
jgi:hypothetical protein